MLYLKRYRNARQDVRSSSVFRHAPTCWAPKLWLGRFRSIIRQ